MEIPDMILGGGIMLICAAFGCVFRTMFLNTR